MLTSRRAIGASISYNHVKPAEVGDRIFYSLRGRLRVLDVVSKREDLHVRLLSYLLLDGVEVGSTARDQSKLGSCTCVESRYDWTDTP